MHQRWWCCMLNNTAINRHAYNETHNFFSFSFMVILHQCFIAISGYQCLTCIVHITLHLDLIILLIPCLYFVKCASNQKPTSNIISSYPGRRVGSPVQPDDAESAGLQWEPWASPHVPGSSHSVVPASSTSNQLHHGHHGSAYATSVWLPARHRTPPSSTASTSSIPACHAGSTTPTRLHAAPSPSTGTTLVIVKRHQAKVLWFPQFIYLELSVSLLSCSTLHQVGMFHISDHHWRAQWTFSTSHLVDISNECKIRPYICVGVTGY